jgi:hypothetical protein
MIIVALTFAYGYGLLTGFGIEEGKFKLEAVKSGHAEWVVIDETGKTEFRWKEVK